MGSDGARTWLEAKLESLESLGCGEAAQALPRAVAIMRLSLSHLRAYLQRLPACEDGEAGRAT